MNTGLGRVLYTLACLLLPAPKGRRHKPARPALSDDTVPIRAIARNPYPDPQETS